MAVVANYRPFYRAFELPGRFTPWIPVAPKIKNVYPKSRRCGSAALNRDDYIEAKMRNFNHGFHRFHG